MTATTDPLSRSVAARQVARSTPESRGLRRDEVRMMVVLGADVAHATVRDLPSFLDPGDLVVVNRSATRGAAWDGTRANGRPTTVHLATHAGGARWVVELRRPDRTGPQVDGRIGEEVSFGLGGVARLVRPRTTYADGVRLWEAAVRLPAEPGRAITYAHLDQMPDLDDMQTVFGLETGSAEMASAARPFTTRLVTDLVTRGILVAPVTLHAGVSSPEVGERPQPEWFDVPASTAAVVRHVRSTGGRVIAVGTTSTRALESAVRGGEARAASGWTDRIVTPDMPPVVVDGLITGWHEPAASHRDLLEAVAGRDALTAAYTAAHEHGYLWHEFGDSCLFLPLTPTRQAK